jgi:RND family efflux transporter MFP subunit
MKPLTRSLLAALAAAACARAEPAEHPPAAATRDVAAVRVDGAERAGTYRAAGTVRAARRAELSTRLMGRIESVRVRAGDAVRAGQLLATVERGALSAAQAQAASALDLATSSLRRTERLYADSAVPLVQLEAARNAHAQAEAQVRAVQADLAYADLRAPFAGVVAERRAEPGDNAAPGRPLLVLEDRTARELVVTAPEEVAARIAPGQRVPVEIGSAGRRGTAEVLAVVPGADPRSPTVEIRLRGPADAAPGLAVVAELPAAGSASSLLVPAAALVHRGQLDGVYLFAPDTTLRLRWVRVGRSFGGSVEVVSGLVPGDVVAADAAAVHDGLRARPAVLGAGDR